MRRTTGCAYVIALVAAVVFTQPVGAAGSGVKLYSSADPVAAGEPFEVALAFELPEGAFIFWENPGVAGDAPSVTWTLPDGFEIGELRFPVPTTKEVEERKANVIAGRPVLLATVMPPKDLSAGAKVAIAGDIVWSVAGERRTDRVQIELSAGEKAKPIEDEDTGFLFKIAHRKLPVPSGKGKFATITSQSSTSEIAEGDRFELTLDVKLKKGYHAQSNAPFGEFFVPTTIFFKRVEGLAFGEPVWPEAHVRTDPNLGRISEFEGDFKVTVPVSVEAPTASENVTVAGLFKYQACEDSGRCFPPEAIEWSVRLTSSTVRSGAPPEAVNRNPTDTDGMVAAAVEPAEPHETEEKSFSYEVYGADQGGLGQYLKGLGLFGAVIGGLLGGLILNIMPCVLPVISIKILSFVQQANEKPRRVFQLGLTFCAGIVVSFWFLAGGILILQQLTGSTRGWGAFFQEPKFVVGMIAIMFAFALNLFGVFEIMLPGATAGKLAGATEAEGFTGAFMKGVLATLLATPCTAPFLAPAISFALAGGPLLVFVIFTSAGVGMAFPYALLTAKPAWMKYLPKPGNWMNAFKQLMGFLLIGTVVWLLWILGKLTGESGVVWTVSALAFLGLACWLFGKVGYGWKTSRKLLAYVGAFGIAAFGAWFSYGMSLDAPRLDWVSYEPGLARKLAAEGHTVYVDYTAAWCLTCQVNKKFVFGNKRVLSKMSDFNVIPMKADYTNYDVFIGDDLRRFDRDAVPLNVIYRPSKPDVPLVLPVALTPGIVMGALEKAGPSTAPSPATDAASAG